MDVSWSEAQVYAAMWRNQQAGISQPSYQEIGEDAEVSNMTVKRAVDKFLANGVMEAERQTGPERERIVPGSVRIIVPPQQLRVWMTLPAAFDIITGLIDEPGS